MDTEWAGKNIVYFDEIDSTNNRAKELGEKDGVHGTLLVQIVRWLEKGEEAVWESPKGISIYMTPLSVQRSDTDKGTDADISYG